MPDANGKICYIEMPATDVARSADFYSRVFNWKIRSRGDGATAFDDGIGNVSGTWTPKKKPADDPGFVVYIMVADINTTIDAIVANGGTITQPVHPGSREVIALFRDPGGNLLGVYEQKGIA